MTGNQTMGAAFCIALLIGLLIASMARAQACAPCDLDGNGAVTVADWGAFLAAFGAKKGEPKYDARVDFDGNGSIGATDFAVFARFCPLGTK